MEAACERICQKYQYPFSGRGHYLSLFEIEIFFSKSPRKILSRGLLVRISQAQSTKICPGDLWSRERPSLVEHWEKRVDWESVLFIKSANKRIYAVWKFQTENFHRMRTLVHISFSQAILLLIDFVMNWLRSGLSNKYRLKNFHPNLYSKYYYYILIWLTTR